MSYFFLPQDYDRLLIRRQELARYYQQIKSGLAEDASQSSETWHDNYIFEQAMRDLDLYGKRLSELDELIGQAEIIYPADNSASVAIGSRVELIDEQETKTVFKIGSYNSGGRPEHAEHEKDGIVIVAYNSPLGQKLLRRRLGEELQLFLAGAVKKYRIKAID
ncbi:MAG: GreA/GreB family elongation factor [Patescibacteria group bacterium]|jgi:transcription elongation GreA/GreB family factor